MELGQIYIDNGDENMDINDLGCEEYPEEWKQLRDNLLSKAGQDVVSSHSWSYCESDVIFLRSCSDISCSELKTFSLNSQSEELLECSWCDDLFLTSGQLTRHWLVTHLQWDTACHKCHQQIDNSLLRHECQYPCSGCHKTHKTKAALMRHILKVHSEFYCVLCESTQHSLEEMRKHVEDETRMMENSCLLCKSHLNQTTKGMKEHLLKAHFGPIVINKPTVFEDKSSQSSDIELITHISMKYRPNKTETYQFDNYSCPHCHRKFSAQSGLKIHVGIAHKGGKVIFCSRCPSAFADVSLCKSHFKEEHSKNHSQKRKTEAQVVREPHKSLVPSNLPVEGSDDNFSICSNFNNNNNSQDNNNGNANYNNNNQNIDTTIPEPQSRAIVTSTSPPMTETQPAQQQRKKKHQRPLPDLLKIDSGEEGKLVTPAPLIPTQQIDLKIKPIDSLKATNDVIVKKVINEQPIAPKPVKTILPAPVVSSNYQVIMPNNQPQQQQVYVPAMTNTGTTILLKIEEAQRHLNTGLVTFRPSSSTTNSQTAPAQPTNRGNASKNASPQPIREESDKTIMRDKVALNLPVVMTKRTNKKLAQDNPFFKIKRVSAGLEGECRSCQQVFSFLNTRSMVQHYHIQHGQNIQINSFPL